MFSLPGSGGGEGQKVLTNGHPSLWLGQYPGCRGGPAVAWGSTLDDEVGLVVNNTQSPWVKVVK